MATDDQQILVTGQAPTPASWVVPGTGQVTPRSIFAHYDGTGAASAFLPALKIISDGGVTVGIYPIGGGDLIAAGGSADVSWFPGVGGGSGAFTSGAWTQVFHYDVPALSTAASIDTVGSTWSNTSNNIFGILVGQSTSAASNDELLYTFNNDGLSHYGTSFFYEDQYISTTPGVFHTKANVLNPSGAMAQGGASGDTLGWSSYFFVIPKQYQSTADGQLISYGGYSGLVSAAVGGGVTNYEFSSITRLAFTWQSGAKFKAGSSLTLWAV